MVLTLPEPVSRYFEAANRGDRAAMAPLFSPAAVVHDEGNTHADPTAVSAWLHDVEARYRPRYQLKSAETDGTVTTVAFEVSGTFPGSPATLRQAFTLDGDRIIHLRTL